MSFFGDFELKMIYFGKLKKFWLIRRLKRMKVEVATMYSEQVLVRRVFKVFNEIHQKRKEYLRMIKLLLAGSEFCVVEKI